MRKPLDIKAAIASAATTGALGYVRLPSARFFGFFGTYAVTQDWVLPDCGVYPDEKIELEDHEGRVVLVFNTSGLMEIRKGFIWDGPSAIAWDRKENLKASAGHDGGFRGTRSGKFGDMWEAVQKHFDVLYGAMCAQAGMWSWWAKVNEWAVRWRGRNSAKPQPEDQLQERHAP